MNVIKKIIILSLGILLAGSLWCAYKCFMYEHPERDLTVSLLRQYHDEYDEIVKSEQGSWANPIYRHYHEFKQYFLFSFLKKIGFMKPDLWNKKQFKTIIRDVTTVRQMDFSGHKKITRVLADGANVIVLSDLHASFHALVRVLEDLKQRNIIDEGLHIIDPDYYILFLGDAINRYAYSLETLYVILDLMKKNPEHVVYMRGDQETQERWKDYDLKYAIEIRAQGYVEKAVPFEREINAFFETLPEIMAIKSDKKTDHCLWFMHQGILRDRGTFARGNDPKRQSLTDFFDQLKPVKALVRGEDFSRAHLYTQGLVLFQPEYGITTWSVLSASNYIYQASLNILEDSYVQVAVKNPIEASTISLYAKQFNSDGSFEGRAKYNIVSAQQIEKDKHENVVLDNVVPFGSTVAITKIATDLGRGVRRAVATVFEEENKKGGVKGSFLKSLILDDRYNPEFARENVDLFIREGIKYCLVPTGSPTLGSYIDLVKDGKISALFPMTGTTWFRDKENKNIVHLRASYKDEVFALIDYLVNTYGAKKFALFYLLAGSAIPDWCHQALEKHGIKAWLDLPFTRVQSDFKQEAQKILEMQPDAIGIFAAADQVKEIIRQIGVYNLHGKRLFGYSFLDERSLRTFMDQLGLKMLLAHVVPDPARSDIEIVKQYRAAMDKKRYPYDALSLEAYIATRLLLDALEHVGADADPGNVMAYFESLKNYDFHGLKLNFNPETRCLAQNVWLEVGPKKWIKMPIES